MTLPAATHLVGDDLGGRVKVDDAGGEIKLAAVSGDAVGAVTPRAVQGGCP